MNGGRVKNQPTSNQTIAVNQGQGESLSKETLPIITEDFKVKVPPQFTGVVGSDAGVTSRVGDLGL